MLSYVAYANYLSSISFEFELIYKTYHAMQCYIITNFKQTNLFGIKLYIVLAFFTII